MNFEIPDINFDEFEALSIKIDRGHRQVITLDFQAKPFYEKLGFSVFGQLPEYPKGHNILFSESAIT